MTKEKENKEFDSPKEEQKELKKYSLKEYITGSILAKDTFRKQLSFIIFLFALGFIYIASRYHAERLTRETSNLQTELDELRAESVTVASELMFSCRQSQVLKLIQENDLGLKESTRPPTRIKMRD